jgi:hypothetical protein
MPPREAFLGQCSLRLNGIVTLVDTHRDLLVVQDETGAVALREPPKTAFRSRVEGDGSVFGVAVFMVTPLVGVF